MKPGILVAEFLSIERKAFYPSFHLALLCLYQRDSSAHNTALGIKTVHVFIFLVGEGQSNSVVCRISVFILACLAKNPTVSAVGNSPGKIS